MKQIVTRLALLSLVLAACGTHKTQPTQGPALVDDVDNASFASISAADWFPMSVGNRWAFGRTATEDARAEVAHVIDVAYTVDGMGIVRNLSGFGRDQWFGFGTRSPSVFYVWNEDGQEWSPFAKFGRATGTTWTTKIDDGGCGTFEARVAKRRFQVETSAGTFSNAYRIDYTLRPQPQVRCARPALMSITFVQNTGLAAYGEQNQWTMLSSEVSGERLPGNCQPTGCGGQVCADHTVFTTCIVAPEHSCYETATCAAQADGQCSWTPTEELTECLKRVY